MTGSTDLLRTTAAYLLGRAGGRFHPLKLLIEVTSVCNLACIMCPHPVMRRSKQHMRLELFKKIVDESKNVVHEYQLSLIGEPLLNPHVYEMIEYAHAGGRFVSLFSNGTLIDEKRAQALVRSGLDRILITIDGATPETYARVRVNGDLDTTVGNLKTLLSVRDALESATPEVVLQIIEMKETEAEIEAFRRRFLEPALKLRVRPFDTHGGDDRVMEHVPRSWNRRPLRRCTQLYSTMTIASDGTMLPCCRDTDGTTALGNVNTQGVLDAWWGRKAVAFRRTHGKSELCRNCHESLRELAHLATFVKRHLLPRRRPERSAHPTPTGHH